jgi:hypothetical protein
MKKIVMFGLFTLLFLKVNIYAQQEAGDKEIGIAGMFYRSIGGDMTIANASVQGKLGLYITDNLEFGVSPILRWTYTSYKTTEYVMEPTTTYPYYRYVTKEVTKSNDNTSSGAGVFITYSFLASSTAVPYFGAQYYKNDFKEKDDKGSAGINAGVKFFISRNAAWDFGLNYLFDLNEKSEGSSDGFLLLQIGLSFIF